MPPEVADPFQLCGVTIEGKYRIASVVGDGGFGVVYRGVHKGFGELIAVKCLKLPATLEEKERDQLLEQLRDEGRLLHRLSRASSSIVQALDVGAFTTPAGIWVPYLVLEWLEGETLAEFLRNRKERDEGGMGLAEAVRLLDPAARALAVAHGQKIAHRDVKPANLFVTEVGGAKTLKVLDFGIAKVLSEHASFTQALAATAKGPSAFTPRYGAPEQFNKQRGATGPWTDVFALALILVELVSGKKALEGDDPTQLYIAAADPSMRPTLRARGVTAIDSVETVLSRALSVEAKHRYPDAGQFWDALTAALAGGDAATQRALPASGAAKSVASQGDMSTAEYAVKERLDVVTDGPALREEATAKEKGQDAVSPTMPVESLRKPASAPPKVIESAQAINKAPRANGHEHTAASAVAKPASLREDDPMAETPVPARSAGISRPALDSNGEGKDVSKRDPSSPPLASKRDPKSEARSTPPEKPAGDPASAPARRSVWPWIAAVVLLGGGTFLYLSFDPPRGTEGPPKRGASTGVAPNAKTTSTGAAASASGSASASASAPASASAAPAVPAPVEPPADMVFVAPAKFRMGEGATARDVTLTRGFFIDRHEVPVRAYQECMAKRMCSPADRVAVTPEQPVGIDASVAPSRAPDEFSDTWSRRCNEPRKALDHPINCVDYSSAEGYCRWRGRRLPTEAEWELATRGTEGRVYAWGAAEPDCGRACTDRNADCRVRDGLVATCGAGLHPGDRTPEGLYDLGGNVAEWVSDGYAAALPGGVDPKGDPAAVLRVVRGGSFFAGTDQLRATWRNAAAPVTAHVTIGFRCAMDAEAPAP